VQGPDPVSGLMRDVPAAFHSFHSRRAGSGDCRLMLVIAHRGASWDLPGNTLPAFERAIADGADFVEFDVHARREGTLVVTHDPPRAAAAVELPSLEQVLDLCRGRIGVMVELKSPYRYRRHDIVPRTLALLDDAAVVVCFQRGALELVRRLRPELRTVQHVGFGVSIRRAAGAWAVGFENGRATRRGVARAQALGFATTVYTVNEPARIPELAALGVTGIFTDRPELARRVLQRG
jgi:glycerophosphoryl diester phosphodiesterase